MRRGPKYEKATDLPDDEKCVDAMNAYEIGLDVVRVACQLADESESVGQLALLHVTMTDGSTKVEKTFDDVYMAFHSDQGKRDILLMVGDVVEVRGDDGWDYSFLKSKFLVECFTIAELADFVMGSEGEIFRRPSRGQWRADSVPTKERIMAMHGTTLHDLHAVGGGGTILRAEGAEWRQIDCGLGSDLRCVLVESETVTVAGNRGIAGQLRGGEFTFFDTGIEGDILSLCRFRGNLYFADSEFGVHVLKGSTFAPVLEFGYVYKLQTGPDWMTATSAGIILQFNGNDWRAIELGHSAGYIARVFDLNGDEE
jgi:hypothetical protein